MAVKKVQSLRLFAHKILFEPNLLHQKGISANYIKQIV